MWSIIWCFNIRICCWNITRSQGKQRRRGRVRGRLRSQYYGSPFRLTVRDSTSRASSSGGVFDRPKKILWSSRTSEPSIGWERCGASGPVGVDRSTSRSGSILFRQPANRKRKSALCTATAHQQKQKKKKHLTIGLINTAPACYLQSQANFMPVLRSRRNSRPIKGNLWRGSNGSTYFVPCCKLLPNCLGKNWPSWSVIWKMNVLTWCMV